MSGPVWTDRDGLSVTAPEPPEGGSHYPDIGAFQGASYDRNAFTRGTAQETRFLIEALELAPGQLVADVGCGTGRHAATLVGEGLRCVGIDIAHALVAAAPVGPLLACGDARALPLREGCADAALSLCQGGFGLTPDTDRQVLGELARVLRPGGRLALTAFSLAFAVRWAAPEDAFDLDRGLVWTPADVRGPDGQRRTFDLWTACYTPGHLRDALGSVGLQVQAVYGAEPGAYLAQPPTVAHPELLVIAAKVAGNPATHRNRNYE